MTWEFIYFSLLQIAEGKNYKFAKANIQACAEANARMNKVQQKLRTACLEEALPKRCENYYGLDL